MSEIRKHLGTFASGIVQAAWFVGWLLMAAVAVGTLSRMVVWGFLYGWRAWS